MPKIETYSGSGGVAQIRQASASDFADTRGLEKLTKSLEESKLKLDKFRQDQAKLEMARVMAEGRQSWLIELDKRQQAVENGELDYQGFTDNFNKDYSDWADDLAKNFSNPEMAYELRVNLIEMQTPLMGSAMNFEAAKRAYKIKENYNTINNAALNEIYSAETPDQIKNTLDQFQSITKTMPKEVANQMNNDIGNISAIKMIALAETKSEVDDVTDWYIDGYSIASPSDVAAFLGVAENQKEFIEKKAFAEIQENFKNAYESAKYGDLQPGWAQQLVTPYLAELNPESKEYAEIQNMIVQVNQVNEIGFTVSEITPQKYSEQIKEIQSQIDSAKNPEESNFLRSKLAMYQDAYANRNKKLIEDFATTAIEKNALVGNYYDMYSKALEDGNNDLAARCFSDYIAAIDGYANKIGWTGNINYLPPMQVQQISSEIESALRKENGLVEVSDKMDAYKSLFGEKFPAILRQLSKENKNFGALYVASKNKPTSVKADIIAALNYQLVDPERYANLTKDEITGLTDSKIAKYEQAFSQNQMIDEQMYRRVTYEALSKMYYLQTNSASEAKEKALKAAYGDIGVFDKIVYPIEKQDSISKLMYSAKSTLLDEKNISLPIGATGIASANINENISDYVDWVTAPDGNGVMAVWIEATGSNREPVKRNDGSIVIYDWDQLDLNSYKYKQPKKKLYYP